MIPEIAEPLLDASLRDLRRALAAGHPIDAAALDDTEYRGITLGPKILSKLSWKTFQKTFHRDRGTGKLRGWNVRMEQTGIDGPPVPIKKNGVPKTWGHYSVYEAKGTRLAAPYDQALLIDYGVRGNGLLVGRMRDPLVAVEAGNPDILLGVSYLDLGWFRIMTPTYFLLLREGPLSYVPPLP
ncbi:MAG TPA: hypothetical protein VLM85_25970 [Polyangiaceae bacterium]|nr:hypothetical protein [Polyangiaceae bacterium]